MEMQQQQQHSIQNPIAFLQMTQVQIQDLQVRMRLKGYTPDQQKQLWYELLVKQQQKLGLPMPAGFGRASSSASTGRSDAASDSTTTTTSDSSTSTSGTTTTASGTTNGTGTVSGGGGVPSSNSKSNKDSSNTASAVGGSAGAKKVVTFAEGTRPSDAVSGISTMTATSTGTGTTTTNTTTTTDDDDDESDEEEEESDDESTADGSAPASAHNSKTAHSHNIPSTTNVNSSTGSLTAAPERPGEGFDDEDGAHQQAGGLATIPAAVAADGRGNSSFDKDNGDALAEVRKHSGSPKKPAAAVVSAAVDDGSAGDAVVVDDEQHQSAPVAVGEFAAVAAPAPAGGAPHPPPGRNRRAHRETKKPHHQHHHEGEDAAASGTVSTAAAGATQPGGLDSVSNPGVERAQDTLQLKPKPPAAIVSPPKHQEDDATTATDTDEEEEEDSNAQRPPHQHHHQKKPADDDESDEEEDDDNDEPAELPVVDYLSQWSDTELTIKAQAALKPPTITRAFWVSGSGAAANSDALCPSPTFRALDGALALERQAPAAQQPDVSKSVLMSALRFLGLAEVNILQRIATLRATFPLKYARAAEFVEKQIVDVARARISSRILSAETFAGSGEATLSSMGRELRALGWASVANLRDLCAMEWYPAKKAMLFTALQANGDALGASAAPVMVPLATLEKHVDAIRVSPLQWLVKRAPAEPDLLLASFAGGGVGGGGMSSSAASLLSQHELSSIQAAVQTFVHLCVYLNRLINANLMPPDFKSTISTAGFLSKVMADISSGTGLTPQPADGNSENYNNGNTGEASLLRSRLFVMAANRLLRIPAAPDNNNLTRLARPEMGSVPFLWSFSKQDPAVSLLQQQQQQQRSANIGGTMLGQQSTAAPNVGQQVCFAVSLSRIRLGGILTATEVQYVMPASIHVLASLVGDNFGVTPPVKLGPCRAGGDKGDDRETMEFDTPVTLFVGATLSDIVYFEVTLVDSRTSEVKCLGFTSITVAHLVAECLDTPNERNPAILAQALQVSDVSFQHRALPGQLEAALWLNGGTFFQRKAAPKGTRQVGIACCAAPAPEASISALITPVTQKSITDIMASTASAAGLVPPRLPDAFVDRCVVPITLLGSMLKKSPLSVAQTQNQLQQGGVSSIISSSMMGLPVLQPRGDFSFQQPGIGYAAPGTVKQHIVQEALRCIDAVTKGADPQPTDWVIASKTAMATAKVQPPLFVGTNRW